MLASLSSQTDQYPVHHQGQVQGPSHVDCIEATIMACVYPASVIVAKVDTSKRLPFSSVWTAISTIKQSGMNAEEARLISLATEVDRDGANIDRYSQYSVDSFNREVNQTNAIDSRIQSLVNDYNQDIDAFNRELERVGTHIH